MKRLVVIFLFASLAYSQLFVSPSLAYLRLLERRRGMDGAFSKLASVCPSKGQQYNEAWNKSMTCLEGLDETQISICSLIEGSFQNCSLPFVEFAEDCVHERSKEIPSLIYQGLNSAVAHLCKADGEHIFELFNSCWRKPNPRTVRCQNRIITRIQNFAKKNPNKRDVCKLVTLAKPCLRNHLKSSCGSNITRDSFDNLFEAITAPCRISDVDEIISRTKIIDVLANR